MCPAVTCFLFVMNSKIFKKTSCLFNMSLINENVYLIRRYLWLRDFVICMVHVFYNTLCRLYDAASRWSIKTKGERPISLFLFSHFLVRLPILIFYVEIFPLSFSFLFSFLLQKAFFLILSSFPILKTFLHTEKFSVTIWSKVQVKDAVLSQEQKMSPLVPNLSITDCSELSLIHYFSTGFFKSQCHAYNTVHPLTLVTACPLISSFKNNDRKMVLKLY